MSLARRILIIGGIALALWGMAHGLWYAVFAEHQALDTIGASLSSAFANAATQHPERAHAALGCRGASRTDFRYDDTAGRNRLIVLEVNTQPGMTPTSLVPEQAAYKGMSFRALVRWILEDASCGR